MKFMMSIIAVILFFFSSNSFSGQSNNSEIVGIEQRDNGIVKLSVIHGTHNSLPQCSFSGGDFLFDATSPVGKNMLSIAMAAFMGSKNINIETNTCFSFSNNADTQLNKVDRITVVK